MKTGKIKEFDKVLLFGPLIPSFKLQLIGCFPGMHNEFVLFKHYCLKLTNCIPFSVLSLSHIKTVIRTTSWSYLNSLLIQQVNACINFKIHDTIS